MAGRRRAAPGAVVPHMGWNTVEVPSGSRLFAGIEDERFYFVHSYGVRDWDLVTNDRTAAPLVTWAEHGGDRFVAAVENGRCARRSSTPRSPATPARRCCELGRVAESLADARPGFRDAAATRT